MRLPGYLHTVAAIAGISPESMAVRDRELVRAGLRESTRGKRSDVPTLAEHLMVIFAGLSDAATSRIAADVSDWMNLPLRASPFPLPEGRLIDLLPVAIRQIASGEIDAPRPELIVNYARREVTFVVGKEQSVWFSHNAPVSIEGAERIALLNPRVVARIVAFYREVIAPNELAD